jgi:hypothetical protein
MLPLEQIVKINSTAKPAQPVNAPWHPESFAALRLAAAEMPRLDLTTISPAYNATGYFACNRDELIHDVTEHFLRHPASSYAIVGEYCETVHWAAFERSYAVELDKAA